MKGLQNNYEMMKFPFIVNSTSKGNSMSLRSFHYHHLLSDISYVRRYEGIHMCSTLGYLLFYKLISFRKRPLSFSFCPDEG